MSNSNTQPPYWSSRLLRLLVKEELLEEIDGHMEERFIDNVESYGDRKARWLYRFDTIKLLRPALIKNIGGDYQLNNFGMLTNTLKITWRQMRKQKIFSSIKVGGFALGIAACILISLYIEHQVNYDMHYEDGDRIYRVVNQWSEAGEVGYWTNVHGPLKEMLEDNIPEMETVARLVLWPWGDAGKNHMRTVESSINRYEEGFMYADPELLEILEIPMIYGSRGNALSSPKTIVISKSKADVYFPDENPVGKSIILNNNPQSTFVIGGVMEDFPVNSHLQGDFILTLFERKEGPGTSGWCCTNYTMYAKLTPGADKLAVQKKTGQLRNSLVINKLKEIGESGIDEMVQYQSYYLQPVKSIYLNPEEVEDYHTHGSQDLVWIFGMMATIILFLAVINFVNLSTANSISRAKEVGLRKVVGSVRSKLISQYLIEACLYSFLAVLLGLIVAWISLPMFNELASTSLSIPWVSLEFISTLLITSLFIGLLSGVYPAFVLSSFKPVEALKGTAKNKSNSLFRGGMVVFQFGATIILIIGALVTNKQFELIMNKPLGYNKEQVVNILGLDSFEESQRLSLKEEFLRLSFVKDASLSDYLPVEGGKIQNRGYWLAGRKQIDNGFEAARWVVDEDYLQLMEMEVIQGRNFNRGTQDKQSIIINQQMAQALTLDEPIGLQVVDMFDEKYTIIGVVEDFHFESMLGGLRPLAMVHGSGTSTLSLRVESQDVEAAMSSISNVWDTFSQKQAIRYAFMDERFELMYLGLQRAKGIFLAFALLSIVVACLGLLALSIQVTEQRSKEMSVRKVLGASVKSIFVSLTFDFLKLVLIAIVFATPLAWYFADFLLEDIANRIDLSWHLFAIASVLSILIAIGTISYEALKSAFSNPVKQLRSE